jgi:hypothetical protein
MWGQVMCSQCITSVLCRFEGTHLAATAAPNIQYMLPTPAHFLQRRSAVGLAGTTLAAATAPHTYTCECCPMAAVCDIFPVVIQHHCLQRLSCCCTCRFDSPLFYSAAQLAELAGTTLAAATTARKAALDRSWQQLKPAVQQMLQQVCHFACMYYSTHKQPLGQRHFWPST